MDQRNVLLVQAILLVAAFASGESAILKCYNCLSTTNEYCRDPFVKSDKLMPTECDLQKVQQIGSGLINSISSIGHKFGLDIPQGSGDLSNVQWACMKVDYLDDKGNNFTLRGCRQPGSEIAVLDLCKKPPSSMKVTYCDSCDGEGCNGAERLSGISALFFLLVPCLVSLKAIAA